MNRFLILFSCVAITVGGSLSTAKDTAKKEDENTASIQKNTTTTSAKASLCEGVNKEPDTAGNQPCLQDERLADRQETAAYVQDVTPGPGNARGSSQYSGAFSNQTAAFPGSPSSSGRSNDKDHQQ